MSAASTEISPGPQKSRKRLRFLPLVTGAYAFAIYMRTAAPTIYWGDGIELSAVCATGGIAHPTGYPLFTMLGYLVCLLFPGNPAWGTNLLCALFGAVAAGVFFHVIILTLEFLPDHFFLHSWYKEILACAGALLLAFSRTFWFHSTTTEVYSLHVLFVTLLMLFFLKYIHKGKAGSLLAFFGIWGLSFSNHMLSLTLFPLGIAMLVVFFLRKGRGKILILAAVLFVLGLMPYLYLPLRAASRPELNWGDPSNLKNFLWLVSGGEFKTHKFLMEAPGIPFTLSRFGVYLLARGLHLARWFPAEFYSFAPQPNIIQVLIFIVCAFFGLYGTAILFRKNRGAALGLSGSLLMGLVMIFLYNIPDIEPYFLCLLPSLLLLGILGWTVILHYVEITLFERKINFLPFLLLILPFISLGSHYSAQDKSRNSGAYEYGIKILHHAPAHAMIVTFGDNDIYILWYFQKARGQRPDVTIIGSNFIHNGWYASYFKEGGKDQPQITIRQTETPCSKGDFYLDLMLWVINPNLDRHPILLCSTDPLLEEMYKIEKIVRVVDEDVYTREQVYFLPYPWLYRLSRK